MEMGNNRNSAGICVVRKQCQCWRWRTIFWTCFDVI